MNSIQKSSRLLIRISQAANFRSFTNSAIKMTSSVQLPTVQKAFKFTNVNKDLVLTESPLPTPNFNQVVLKLAAAGVCHSDLHILDGQFPIPTGTVLGHEIAGTIVDQGPGVDVSKFPVSSTQLYAAHGPNPCGYCNECRDGKDNLCHSPTRVQYGLGFDGGYEQYTLANVRNLVKVPEGVSAEVAAVTTDAVLTPYHALKKAQVNGLSKILIIGLGGLGINAVQIAKALGAHVTAFDLKESSRELAKKFGADVVLDKLSIDEECKEFDFVADIVAVQSTFELACKHVKSNGLVIPLGLGSAKLTFDLNDLCVREIKILGSFWGTSLDQTEVFELIKKGVVTPQVETGDFKDLNSILHRLAKGEIKSRLVLTNFDKV